MGIVESRQIDSAHSCAGLGALLALLAAVGVSCGSLLLDEILRLLIAQNATSNKAHNLPNSLS